MYDKIMVIGNLGSDPEMRYTPDGTAVTNFSVAANRRWKDHNGNPQEQTIWYRVTVWGSQAESVNEYLEKGRQVAIEGQLQGDPDTGGPRVFERQDGTYGSSYEVRAQRVIFLGQKNGSGQGQGKKYDPVIDGPPPSKNVDLEDIF